ncbi:MAG TPA: HDIG domain-containing protein [Polyangiaceae bacterium]|nr:HDIG domain-containing protein [Polyangiaceae bacterium]
MSLVFALLLTLVHVVDRFALRPELGASTPVTLRVPSGPRLIRHGGKVELRNLHDHLIIPRGTVLRTDDREHQYAFAYDSANRPPSGARIRGTVVILFTLAFALVTYLRKFGQSRLKLLRAQLGVLIAMGLCAIAAKWLLVWTGLPEYWIPVATVPLWVATSFDRRTAMLVTVVLAFVLASFQSFDVMLLCALLAQGMSSILFFLDRKRPVHMLLSGSLAGVCTAVLYVALRVTFEGSFDFGAELFHPTRGALFACLGGGVASGALAMLLRSPAERLLGHVSRERLLDLADLEQPLLQKLAREAPGTYEHSRAMANLAEQAASAIGADALLTRIGAYYHDLGKTAQSKYFVENLAPGERSPHEELEPDVSADAIMAHVVIGTRILRGGGIPEAVVEFSYTHHGTQVVEFFWNKCQQQGNPKNLDASYFRYPGMKPQTKETAILMLVDSIEAASRTVDPPDRNNFETMIERIVFTKLKQGQLDECGLELKELRTVTRRMAEALVNMHHHRIKYQWQNKQAEQFGVPSEALSGNQPVVAAVKPEGDGHGHGPGC